MRAVVAKVGKAEERAVRTVVAFIGKHKLKLGGLESHRLVKHELKPGVL